MIIEEYIRMIISFAFGLIGSLLVLANSRFLRKNIIFIIALILAAGLAGTGIYFILHSSKATDKRLLFPMFTPITAILLYLYTSLIYKKIKKMEVILHMHGLFPVRQYERYVTRPERIITFCLLILSVLIPYLILILSL